jgi:hypothetical protein
MSEYNLLDFYKDNWGRDPKSGAIFEKHDMDSFMTVNKTFKVDYTCPNGLSIIDIKEIFGEPQRIDTHGIGNKRVISFMYVAAEPEVYLRKQPTFGWLEIQFSANTERVVLFERNRSIPPLE